MSIRYEERLSDSPSVEMVMHGWTECAGSTVRPAESSWHMVLVRFHGSIQLMIVGPWTQAGTISYPKEAELLWIKFKLGTFMPHRLTGSFTNSETALPGAASSSFWLHSSSWQFPDYENADTFIDRLVREEILVSDPVISAVLQGQIQAMASRTLRHRFIQTTGLTQTQIRQIERAQRASTLLQQGVSILDTVEEAGYFDQPHLTRSLKRWIGHTPAQLIHMMHTSHAQANKSI